MALLRGNSENHDAFCGRSSKRPFKDKTPTFFFRSHLSNQNNPMSGLISTGRVIGKKVCKTVAVTKVIVKILTNNVSKEIYSILPQIQCLGLQTSLSL